MAVRIEGLRLDSDFHAAKAGAGLGFALARCVRAVHQEVGVVHILLVAGTNLYRLDPFRLLDGKTENEVPVSICALRRQNERLLGLEDQVWFTEPPSLDKFRGRRQIRGSAFCRALFHPCHDAVNVGVR